MVGLFIYVACSLELGEGRGAERTGGGRGGEGAAGALQGIHTSVDRQKAQLWWGTHGGRAEALECKGHQ